MEEDSKARRLREALRSGSARKKKGQERAISISGSDAVAIGNNNRIFVFNAPRVVQKTVIDPTGGELTPAEKQQISQFVDGVVGASYEGGKPVTHVAVWKQLQSEFKVNTYHALRSKQFNDVLAYLRKLYGQAKRGETLGGKQR